MVCSLKNKCLLDMREGVGVAFCFILSWFFSVQGPFLQFLLIIAPLLCRRNIPPPPLSFGGTANHSHSGPGHRMSSSWYSSPWPG